MFDDYRKRMKNLGSYEGEAKRNTAQKIMNVSWDRDGATKPVYVKWIDKGLPFVDENDVPLKAKFNVKSYHNITGDEVAYLLQFKLDDMRTNPNIKIGSYVQIEDELGNPEWWLIVHLDDRTQFKQFSVLKCTHVYQWVSEVDGNRVIHRCLGVPRNQNSYNSGVWLDHVFQVAENQSIMILPSNSDSNTIFRDTRLIISNDLRYPPITWKVSKIQPKITGCNPLNEKHNPEGITYFTMTEEQFNPVLDNAELEIGDYYKYAIPPTEETDDGNEYKFTYTGTPTLTVGGHYKKITIHKYIGDEEVEITDNIIWSVSTKELESEDIILEPNGATLKIKVINKYSLVGKTVDVRALIGNDEEHIELEVIST